MPSTSCWPPTSESDRRARVEVGSGPVDQGGRMRARARLRMAVAGAGLALALSAAGCSGPASNPAPDTRTAGQTSQPSGSASSAAPPLRVEELVDGLRTPWGLVALPDGSLLVNERDTGQILRIRGADRQVLATLHDVVPGGEGGLLGLVMTPDHARLLAYYTAAQDNRVVAMAWNGSRLGTPQPLLTGIPKGLRHDG